MIFKEIKEDLFNASNEYAIVHCISNDFAFGAGIAKAINEKYNVKEELNSCWGNFDWVGCSLLCKCDDRLIYNLVTKEKYWQEPTYKSLMYCLIDLAEDCKEESITKLVMPRIGCGLDRLNWGKVKECIKRVFQETDIEIIVCSLD